MSTRWNVLQVPVRVPPPPSVKTYQHPSPLPQLRLIVNENDHHLMDGS